MAEIGLRSLTKVFGQDVTAVDGIDLDVRDGEFMVLLGPSGCGKSTTLRMIAGLEAVTSGEILIDGDVVNDVDPAERDLAVVFQNYALYPHMSVAGNLSFGLKLRKLPRDEIDRRIAATAEMLGIGDLLKRRPRQLSGGQQQRVALGRALVRDPAAFLFDEPLSNLDAKLRATMRTELIKLHRMLGKTIVHVTHDQVEAMTMGERICIMRDGRIVQVGPPLEVYRNPADTFVAGFLASPPMNLLDARLGGQTGLDAVELPPVGLPLLEDHKRALAGRAGETITLGIRPEDLDAEPSGAEQGAMTVTVVAVEALGPEVILVGALPGGQEVSARLESDFAAPPGSEVRLHVDLDRLNFFDVDTGRAVTAG